MKRKVTIAATERWGYPNAFSFEVYNSLLYLGCLQMKSNKGFPKKLEFNISDIANLIKINKSGDTYQRIKQSIMQIKATNINFEGKMIIENKTKKYSDKIFSLFDTAAFYGERDEKGQTVDKSYVLFNDIIVNNMNERYNTMYIQYDNYQKLDSGIAKALYLRLYQPLWAIKTNKQDYYCKEYTKLCEWLLLKPQKYMSYIKRQLITHLDLLVKNNIISAYDIKQSDNNKTYIVYFYRVIHSENEKKEKTFSSTEKIQVYEEELKKQYNKEADEFLEELKKSDEEGFNLFYKEAELKAKTKFGKDENSLFFQPTVKSLILEIYHFPDFDEWRKKGVKD